MYTHSKRAHTHIHTNTLTHRCGRACSVYSSWYPHVHTNKTHTNTHTHTYTQTHSYTGAAEPVQYTAAGIPTHIQIKHTHIHTHTHKHTHTYPQTHSHTGAAEPVQYTAAGHPHAHTNKTHKHTYTHIHTNTLTRRCGRACSVYGSWSSPCTKMPQPGSNSQACVGRVAVCGKRIACCCSC